MARSSPMEICAADLSDYLKAESDFAFEVRAVKQLQKAGDVLHGGTYVDAVSGKPRQFDIRLTMSNERRVIRLAVECKNLKNTFPLLVTCLPRREDEAFQHVALSVNINHRTFSDSDQGRMACEAYEPVVRTLHVYSANCMYRVGEPVGKTLVQVGRDSTKTFTVNDAEIYSKWSQALSSADDLVEMCSRDARVKACGFSFSAVVPVLVVPDGTLWQCAFDVNGNQTISPETTKRVPFFVGKESSYREMAFLGPNYTISHLEIVTLSGLSDLLADVCTHEALVPPRIAETMERKLGPCFSDRYW